MERRASEKLEERSPERRVLTRVSGERSTRQSDFTGEKAFKLYDTFGLPLDFIQDACRDVGVEFDQDGFERAMA